VERVVVGGVWGGGGWGGEIWVKCGKTSCKELALNSQFPSKAGTGMLVDCCFTTAKYIALLYTQ
jgi:hypothetical protein